MVDPELSDRLSKITRKLKISSNTALESVKSYMKKSNSTDPLGNPTGDLQFASLEGLFADLNFKLFYAYTLSVSDNPNFVSYGVTVDGSNLEVKPYEIDKFDKLLKSSIDLSKI